MLDHLVGVQEYCRPLRSLDPAEWRDVAEGIGGEGGSPTGKKEKYMSIPSEFKYKKKPPFTNLVNHILLHGGFFSSIKSRSTFNLIDSDISCIMHKQLALCIEKQLDL